MSFDPAVPPPVVVAAPGPPPRPAPFPSIWWAIGLCVVVQVIANAIGFIVIMAALVAGGGLPMGDLERIETLDPALLGIVANSIAFGAVVFFGWLRTRRPAREVFPLGPVTLDLWFPLIPTLAGGLLLANEATNLMVRYLPPPDWVKEIFESLLGRGTGPAGFIFLVLVAPITEELFFRGVVLQGFLQRYGKARAIVGSAALFGAIHLIPWQVVPAFFLGLFFAWWTIETRSLWPALLAHAFTNGFAFFQGLGQDPQEIFEPVPQPLWLTALGLLFLAIGIYWGVRKFRERRFAADPLSV